MARLIAHCPSCQHNLSVEKLACPQCQTRFEGQFPIPSILLLSEEDQTFILNFVKASGSLKEMAKLLNVSYPTVRNRLDQVIKSVTGVLDTEINTDEKIFSALEKGEISAQEAARLLRAKGDRQC